MCYLILQFLYNPLSYNHSHHDGPSYINHCESRATWDPRHSSVAEVRPTLSHLISATNLCHNTCVTVFSRLWLPCPLATETTTTTCLVLKKLLSTLTSKPCPALEDQVTTELEHRNAENYSCQTMKLLLQPLTS